MNRKHSDRTLRIVIAAMFSAMIAVMTAFVQIKTPTGGYVHLGDSMIYLAASFLPLPYASRRPRSAAVSPTCWSTPRPSSTP